MKRKLSKKAQRFLREHYHLMSERELAKKLHLSRSVLRKEVERMGIKSTGGFISMLKSFFLLNLSIGLFIVIVALFFYFTLGYRAGWNEWRAFRFVMIYWLWGGFSFFALITRFRKLIT